MSSESSDSEMDIDFIPPDLSSEVKSATQNHLPTKSKEKYTKIYDNFIAWKNEKKVNMFSEALFLAYFHEIAKTKKPSTLWVIYSMLKSTVYYKNGIDLKDYANVTTFLKLQSFGYKGNKSKILTDENIKRFLHEAPDDTYLATKVALILGVNGACRSIELYNITMKDIECHDDTAIITLRDTKTKIDRTFVVRGEYLNTMKKYLKLRPKNTTSDRFFLKFQKGKCTKRVIGRHKIAKMPNDIASYLNLTNPECYTGHCFRRSSGVNLTNMKRQGARNFDTAAESYIEVSIGKNAETTNEMIHTVELQALNDSETASHPPITSASCQQPSTSKEQSSFRPSTTDQVAFTARGLMPPVFTPLDNDGKINFSAIPSYAQYLADAGIKSVLVGGTTGENMCMKVADRMRLVDEWVATSETTGLHIMVQVGGAPLADVLALAEYCQRAGAHSLLTLPELYFRPQSVDELVDYVQLVAEAAPQLPVLYYHIPSMSKVEMNMPNFVSAATKRIPNFKGIKFTSNDLSEAAQVLRNLQEDQEIFLGADTLLAPAALLGIKSSIGTTFNLFPELAQQILKAVEDSDVSYARHLQEKLSLAIEAHTCEGAWVPIMKAGMEIVSGIKVGPPALPQKPISEEARSRIAQKLAHLGVVDLK